MKILFINNIFKERALFDNNISTNLILVGYQ